MAQDLNLNRIGSMPAQVDLPEAGASRGPAPQAGEFNSLLKDKVSQTVAAPTAGPVAGANPLKFSSHALTRIRDRGIAMSKEQMDKLEKAVDTAAAKGAKESLILSSDAAFIVSVKNRTVITVLDRNAMMGNVFTNIDSTVVI